MRAHGRFATMGTGQEARKRPEVSGSAAAKRCRQQPARVADESWRKTWRGGKRPRRFACVSSHARAGFGDRCRRRRHLRRAPGNTKCRQRRNRVAGPSLAHTGMPSLFPRRADLLPQQALAIGQLPCNRVRRPILCNKKPQDYFERRRILNQLRRETKWPLLRSRGGSPTPGSKASPDCIGQRDFHVARKRDTTRTLCPDSSEHPARADGERPGCFRQSSAPGAPRHGSSPRPWNNPGKRPGHVRINSREGIPRRHYFGRRRHGTT